MFSGMNKAVKTRMSMVLPGTEVATTASDATTTLNIGYSYVRRLHGCVRLLLGLSMTDILIPVYITSHG